ncbi:hypothetical protein [Microbacterium flavum]|uniref:Uncharacterized protein n=1 Tax=Microbacterium flavum TaxID=415216 RepID=A0ABS5XU01_9MICO|nr:hypothetical protein [Microbacterium flavum]MBT8797995.1 hypothetical protein [Microbacterium flavum]
MDLASSPALTALHRAGECLRAARTDIGEARVRARALTDATAWRSRATDGYRAGVGLLCDELARLEAAVDVAEDEVECAARDERLRATRMPGAGR